MTRAAMKGAGAATVLQGRGEQVLPGVWRLRLPLPFKGIPHGNAWALEAERGIVLVDCGLHTSASTAELDRALAMVGFDLAEVSLLVCTHAHPDHYGQAAVVVARSGCELWMHPRHQHVTRAVRDPAGAAALRLAAATQSGVPDALLPRPDRDTQAAAPGLDVAAVVEPDRPLLDGMSVPTALGDWRVIETPGHAPSHVCLYEPGQRLLISGDHLLERVSLHFDFGYSADPVAEFLTSLDAIEACDAAMCLPGHGAPFGAVANRIDVTRREVRTRVERVLQALRAGPSQTAYELATTVYGGPLPREMGEHVLSEAMSYLRHLEAHGLARRSRDGAVQRWIAT